jgi:hypothetical protein
MSFNIRFDGIEEAKKHLEKMLQASERTMDVINKRFYREIMENKKVEFSSTLGCYAVDPEFIIWTLNNATDKDSQFDTNFPRKKMRTSLKRSLR